MYQDHKIIVIVPVYNEETKIGLVIERLKKIVFVDEIVVVDDGSTDQSASISRSLGVTLISMGQVMGVGASLRRGFEYAKSKCDIIVVMAGNNKDEPQEIIRLIHPIIKGLAVIVQGARYVAGGNAGGEMPLYRKIATRLHPLLFSFFVRRRVFDSTNGFRALHVKLLGDDRIRLNQSWLNEYELEPYLLFKALKLGYSFVQVPVTKIYPPKVSGQTKMKPITGWWSILRPIFLLGFNLRK